MSTFVRSAIYRSGHGANRSGERDVRQFAHRLCARRGRQRDADARAAWTFGHRVRSVTLAADKALEFHDDRSRPAGISRPTVRGAQAGHPLLMQFARDGGTIVTQYGQTEMTQPAMLPYPITLTRPADRVTDETAVVRVLDPTSPLLSSPNKIGEADFAIGCKSARFTCRTRSTSSVAHCSRSTTRTSRRMMPRCWSRRWGKGRTSTRPFRSSGSFPPAIPERRACSSTFFQRISEQRQPSERRGVWTGAARER